MPANRCPACSINYPHNVTQCLVCDGGLLFSPYGAVDANWEDMAREKLGEDPEFLFIFVDLYPHTADNNVPVYENSGVLWVTHRNALEAGYSGIESGTILYLNNTFYEVQGWDDKHDRWWIEEINPEAEFDDIPVLSEDDAETS